MICPNCQRENQAGVSFCAFCGQFLAGGQQTPQVPVPSAPSLPPLPNVSAVSPPAVPPPLPGVMCLVCGQIFAPQAPHCPHCKTPRGMIVNPEDPTGSTYLPYGAPYPAPNALSAQPQRGIAVLVLFGVAVVIGLTILSIALVVSIGGAK